MAPRNSGHHVRDTAPTQQLELYVYRLINRQMRNVSWPERFLRWGRGGRWAVGGGGKVWNSVPNGTTTCEIPGTWYIYWYT